MSGILNSVGRTIFKLAYQISPIILTDGIAGANGAGVPGGMLPIVALTEAANFISGLLHGSVGLDLDQFFAQFTPMAGSTLIDNSIGHFPFANQTVAANAVITNPLRVSLRMDCPVQKAGGYTVKLATFTALRAALTKHISLGGTFIVITPSKLYLNCLLVSLKDVTNGSGKQPQVTWQWDFEQPLITLDQAAGAQNAQMSKITNGTPTDGSLSGSTQTAGNQLSGAAPVTMPVATNIPAPANPPTTVGGA